jgi:heavy metal sensor kinase
MTGWWRSHSVRMRLTLLHAAALLVVLVVYVVAIYLVVSRRASEALDAQIRSDYPLAIAVIDQTPEGNLTWMPPFEPSEEEELLWVQVWSADAKQLRLQNFEASLRQIPESQQIAADERMGIVRIDTEPVPFRILSRRDSLEGTPVIVQVGRSETAMRRDLNSLLVILVVGLPLAVAVAGFGGYVLARGALAPIEAMTDRARSITADRLGERLPVHNADDEMGRLATVFNETLGRLEGSFEQMRRFTADVSHELRTPLTAIRSVGEVGLRGHRDADAYRAIIGSMLEEADRLAGLVNRLLTLSRAETGQASLSRDVVDLQRLADDVVAHLSVLAEEKRQSVVVERQGNPEAVADRQVLRQALINLVDNAIKFTPHGGRVQIRLGESPGKTTIDVVDSGPGIPEAARARVFDRFYRADSDGEGGTGLGLSIAKGAVEANGGRLTLEDAGPRGSTFRITMPKKAEPVRRRAG